jgi:hypothetical protein
MKIAIVFGGQPRFFEGPSYDSVRRYLLDRYTCDIYAHFWFSTDPSTVYEAAPWAHLPNLQFPSDTIDKFCELYKPKKIVYESPSVTPPPNREYTNAADPRASYFVTSKYHSIQRAFKLVEHPEDYDFIVFMRSDNVILKLPDLNLFDTNKLYLVPIGETGRNTHRADMFPIFLNDAFYIVPPKYAANVFNAIDYFDIIYDKGCIMNGEEIYSGNIYLHNLIDKAYIFHPSEFQFATQRRDYQYHNINTPHHQHLL